MPQKQTLPKERERRSEQHAVLHLVRVLGFERPQVPGARHSLDGLHEVIVGRGERDEVTRSAGSLALRVADPRMSQRHARFVRDKDVWSVEDLGSTNGTVVDGIRLDRAELEDGTLVELGCTAFVARELLPGGAADVDARELGEPLPGIRTFSTAFEHELRSLARLAATPQSIFIHGETGSGKEVIARAIHAASGRTGDFVAVNCGAIPANLVESELFGYRKGAFSGATEDRLGVLRAADGGTLLLDEIGELPLPAQVALLRVLQQREVMPLGASRPIPIDVRVLAASHRDLEDEVGAGRFREDLWSRIAGYTAQVPALRDRREDFGLLVAAVLARLDVTPRFLSEAGLAMLQYDWPRNVRELEQTLGTATALAGADAIGLAHLPRALQQPRRRRRAPLAGEDIAKRDQLRAVLAKHRGNIAAAGRELGVGRMQIHRWLERYEIEIDDFREK